VNKTKLFKILFHVVQNGILKKKSLKRGGKGGEAKEKGKVFEERGRNLGPFHRGGGGGGRISELVGELKTAEEDCVRLVN